MGKRQRRDPICWFTPSMCIAAPAGTKAKELSPGFPCGWQEPGYMSRPCYLLGLGQCEAGVRARAASETFQGGTEAPWPASSPPDEGPLPTPPSTGF